MSIKEKITKEQILEFSCSAYAEHETSIDPGNFSSFYERLPDWITDNILSVSVYPNLDLQNPIMITFRFGVIMTEILLIGRKSKPVGSRYYDPVSDDFYEGFDYDNRAYLALTKGSEIYYCSNIYKPKKFIDKIYG